MKKGYLYNKGHLSDEAKAYVADMLKKGEYESLDTEIKEHIENCIDCKKSISLIIDISSYDTTDNANQAPLKKNKIIAYLNDHKFYRIAAISMLFIFSGLFIYWLQTMMKSNMKNNGQNISQTLPPKTTINKDTVNRATIKKENKDVVRQEVENHLLAYAELKYMEDVIAASNYRSSDDFNIISPQNKQDYKFGDRILFKWTNAGNSTPLEIIIIDNKDNIILKKKITNPKLSGKYQCSKKLNKGLYYFKINYQKELISVGKFTIH